MFTGLPPVLSYRDPWLMSSGARMRMLTARRRRIAYYYERPDTSTFRYRTFNMTQCLAAEPETNVSAGWFDHQDLHDGGRFLDEADVLVICRTRYNSAVATMVARARARGIPVLFDCDDLVFDPSRVHFLLDCLDIDQANNQNWTNWFGMIGQLHATLRMCDKLITTNEYLATRARELIPDLPTAVVPNYLNQAQQELSESLHAMKRSAGWARTEALHIGYFSGSPTHAKDFRVVAPALTRLMQRDSRIVLRVVGFLDLKGEMAELAQRVEFIPLQDFMNLQRLIAEVEINIAPLQNNVFTNCKSELKFFEAAVCGTVTVATPTFTFRNSIRDGQTGFLAAEHEWDEVLEKAVALVDDMNAYAAFAGRAASYVNEVYGWNRQTSLIERAAFES